LVGLFPVHFPEDGFWQHLSPATPPQAYQAVRGNRRPRRWLKLELAPPVPPLYVRQKEMIPHFCPSCGTRTDIPEHYMGRSVTCQNCRNEFLASIATTRQPVSMPQSVAPAPRKLRRGRSEATLIERWNTLSMKMKIALGVAALLVAALLVGIPVLRNKEFKGKYEEFVFEADQLANLTSYGVNKGDFTRQFARVEAKWHAVPTSGFRGESHSKFQTAMSKWREVVQDWDYKDDWKRDRVPWKMSEAAEKYNEAKVEMR
jgi:hypothetical protein